MRTNHKVEIKSGATAGFWEVDRYYEKTGGHYTGDVYKLVCFPSSDKSGGFVLVSLDAGIWRPLEKDIQSVGKQDDFLKLKAGTEIKITVRG